MKKKQPEDQTSYIVGGQTGALQRVNLGVGAAKSVSATALDTKALSAGKPTLVAGRLSALEVKQLRQRLRLSQKEMSKILQIGEKSYTRWETGKSRPSRSMNLLLCTLRDGRIDFNYSKYLRSPLEHAENILPDRIGRTIYVAGSFSIHTRLHVDYRTDVTLPPLLNECSQNESVSRAQVTSRYHPGSSVGCVNDIEILLDFDDLATPIKRAGLPLLSTRIVNILAKQNGRFPYRCRLKIYGEWYENDRLNSWAKKLIESIDENRNALVTHWKTNSTQGSTIVKVELVHSLEIESQHGFHRGFLAKATAPSAQTESAPLPSFSNFHAPVASNTLSSERAGYYSSYRDPVLPHPPCERLSSMVDAMLAADLIFLSRSTESRLVVVSSNANIWPAMQMALLSGREVVQIHTQTEESNDYGVLAKLQNFKYLSLYS